MNITYAAIIEAAEAKLADAFPDLKLRVELKLTAHQAKRLQQALDAALIPSLLQAIPTAGDGGSSVDGMLQALDNLCGVSNAITDAGEGEPVTLDMGPVRTKVLSHALGNVLIPRLVANLHKANGPEDVLDGVATIIGIHRQLRDEIEAVCKALDAKKEELAARLEDEEIAEIKRNMKRA